MKRNLLILLLLCMIIGNVTLLIALWTAPVALREQRAELLLGWLIGVSVVSIVQVLL